MSDGFAWLLNALRTFPDLGEDAAGLADWPSAQLRLRDALVLAADEDKVLPTSPRDLVPLVRQIILSRENGDELTLSVARHAALPTHEQWMSGDCASTAYVDRFEIQVDHWRPEWLPYAKQHPPARAACLGRDPDLLEPVAEERPPADPFYRAATHRCAYLTAGQRTAIQTVLAARPGSTVIVSLPTRSGKSAAAFVPAILGASREKTAIVVVPTTALALDQERQFLSIQSPLATDVPATLAFHGGLTGAEKQDMKRRIRDGRQTIVFTSPEGLMGALRAAVHDAAAMGRIGLFAIDEAHTVSQWGEDFRPEFQALGGVRRKLLEAGPAPFTTLLMTGTLTATTLDAIVMLFQSPLGTHVVSSVDLRPEPSYWNALSASCEERHDRVLEAVHRLPRPLILYTTRVRDAEDWARDLRDAGYARVATVTGKTAPGRRRAVIEEVRGDAPDSAGEPRTGVDVVVATSAYGLGVDQPDVRVIVHACIPESIDRYYQEVGRGGRDGAPSVSLTLYTEEDRQLARRLSLSTVIGVEKAQERWDAMWAKGRENGSLDTRVVRTDVIPRYLDTNNERNEQWNLLTLLLMQRSKMIDLEFPAPPEESPEDDPEAWERLWLEHVAIGRAANLADPRRWQGLEREAAATHRRDERSLRLMEEALRATQPIDELLREAYSIQRGDSLTLPDLVVHVGGSTGGCPASRAAGRRSRRDAAPNPPALKDADTSMFGPLASRLEGGEALTVGYEPAAPGRRQRLERRVSQAVEALAQAGIRTMAVARDGLGRPAVESAWKTAPSRSVFVADRFDQRRLPACPTLLLADRSTSSRELRAFYGTGQPRVVIAPSTLTDYERPDRLLCDARRPFMSLDDLLDFLS